jgi:hypothetical protein
MHDTNLYPDSVNRNIIIQADRSDFWQVRSRILYLGWHEVRKDCAGGLELSMKVSSTNSGRSTAIVRVSPCIEQRQVTPVRVVVRSVRKDSYISPLDGRRAVEYQHSDDAAALEVPAFVFDVLR